MVAKSFIAVVKFGSPRMTRIGPLPDSTFNHRNFFMKMAMHVDFLHALQGFITGTQLFFFQVKQSLVFSDNIFVDERVFI
jgi:hypothetical protein